MSKSTKISIFNKNVLSKPKINDKETKKDSKTSKSLKTETLKKTTTKTEEKETTSTITKRKGPITLNSKVPTTSKTTTEIKSRNVGSLQKSKTDTKSQPLRAKHTPEILNSLKNVSKSNVMSSVHNVTVLSPPSKRKEIFPAHTPAITTANGEEPSNKISKKIQDDPRSRTRTRTLDPDEVVVLKKPPNSNTGPKSLDTVFGGAVKQDIKNSSRQEKNETDPTSAVKEAVAFEINFDEKKPKVKSETKRAELKNIENVTRPEGLKIREKGRDTVEPQDYEDDFESYESDFETGSSSVEASESILHGSEDESTAENVGSQSSGSDIEDCDESEETQLPITVIHKEKDEERKLDSGNYDMNSRREKLQQMQLQQLHHHQQQQLDSIDTITGNSEQLDSGISYNGNTALLSISSPSKPASASSASYVSTSGAFHLTEKLSKFTKRGRELMNKIQLDEIEYTLFDLKPMSYEYYMKVYGNMNAIQHATQTNENRMNTDTQTNECQYRSTWTQHPPQYDLNFIQNRNLRNLQNFCGEFSDDDNKENDFGKTDTNETNNALLKSLEALQKFRRDELKRTQNIQKPINFDRLNEFLNQTVFTISAILNKSNQSKKFQNSKDMNGISKGYFTLNTNFINALKVVKIFANSNLNLILTVHESLEGVYRSEFLNLISVWTVSESDKPIRLLSSWSEVCRADICSENSDIIVCGLRDGSIAMWDLRETYSFCSKLDGCLRHFPATQSIAPIFSTNESKLIDLGAVVDIKSFRKSNKIYDFKTYKPIQIVSLNDTGILTIWTLIEVGNTISTQEIINNRSKHSKIEYNSPWARVKLIQSEICDLREYLELKNIRIKTDFEKTKSYFENDLFNDDALKELQETQMNELKLGLQGLRFTNLDTGIEHIYIGTNRNFIIACTKTLRTDQFRKIIFDETKFLFATTFRLLKSEKYLVVGLSNGSVMAVNCNLNKLNDQSQSTNSSLDDLNHQNQTNSSKKDDNNDDFDYENGKSCAIQNIIRNERKTHQNSIAGKSDSQESSFDEMNALEKFNDDDTDYFHIFDQQILLDGSILRKNLVQSIEISSDGKKLFVLADGKLRTYDFIIGKEILESNEGDNIHGLAVAKNVPSNKNLIILIRNDEVQVHTTK